MTVKLNPTCQIAQKQVTVQKGEHHVKAFLEKIYNFLFIIIFR
jgi:hypothetical protein